MKQRCALLFHCAILVLLAPHAAAESITGGRYALPVNRYGHFALGTPHEYARLVATTDRSRNLELLLPDDEVFEDVAPRLVHLAPEASAELLVIISNRKTGSRLALVRAAGGTLEISAQASPIGTPRRWLNPVGVADLDGDGRAEIAAVITPHIGGILKVYQRRGAALTEVALLPGFSNHRFGSIEQRLSMPVMIAGRMRLLVPDATRSHLRVIAFDARRLVEVGRCNLAAPVTGDMRAISAAEVSVTLESGPQSLNPGNCVSRDV